MYNASFHRLSKIRFKFWYRTIYHFSLFRIYVASKTCLPNPRSQRFSSMFYSQSVHISRFYVSIHVLFWINFSDGVTYGWKVTNLIAYWHPIIPSPLLKRTSPLHVTVCRYIENHIGCTCVSPFLTSVPFHSPTCILSSGYTALITVGLVWVLRSGSYYFIYRFQKNYWYLKFSYLFTSLMFVRGPTNWGDSLEPQDLGIRTLIILCYTLALRRTFGSQLRNKFIGKKQGGKW